MPHERQNHHRPRRPRVRPPPLDAEKESPRAGRPTLRPAPDVAAPHRTRRRRDTKRQGRMQNAECRNPQEGRMSKKIEIKLSDSDAEALDVVHNFYCTHLAEEEFARQCLMERLTAIQQLINR